MRLMQAEENLQNDLHNLEKLIILIRLLLSLPFLPSEESMSP